MDRSFPFSARHMPEYAPGGCKGVLPQRQKAAPVCQGGLGDSQVGGLSQARRGAMRRSRSIYFVAFLAGALASSSSTACAAASRASGTRDGEQLT